MMVNINLLPWREQLRERRKREFFVRLGGGSVIALLVVIAVHFVFANWLHMEHGLNARLEGEIKIMDQRIAEIQGLKEKQALLIARMDVIQRLQSSRPLGVRLFTSFVKVIPDGVYLTEVTRSGPQIIVEGEAESNMRVSRLMRNIDAAPGVKQAELSEITNTKKALNKNSFKVRMLTRLPVLSEGSHEIHQPN